MTSVFSAIPLPPGYFASRFKGRQHKSSKVSKTVVSSPDSTGVQSAVEARERGDEPDLRQLNCALEALSGLFPDVQPEVFREMLSSFHEESRLEVVADQLLKHKAKWVHGRWLVPREHEERRRYKYRNNVLPGPDRGGVPQEEKFRSIGYKEAVTSALSQEFKGLNTSTIRAVLAEYNYSYTQARPTLLGLTSKSWRYSLTSILMRRKPVSLTNHPLLSWQPAASGDLSHLVPRLKSTMNAELDQELYLTLIFPLEAKLKKEQELSDNQLAKSLNYAEAESLDTLYDCECCFTPTTFEHLSACDSGGHHICFRCICHAANEALYGQGWARSFDAAKCTIRCLAPGMNRHDECHGSIPQNLVKRALEEGEDKEAWTKWEERAAEDILLKCGLALVKCPFCTYAEVDDIYFGGKLPLTGLKTDFLLHPAFGTFMVVYGSVLPSIFALFCLFVGSMLLALCIKLLALQSPAFIRSRKRIARRRHGLKFKCRSPRCGRSSCMHCLKEWRDIHVCYESEQIALRSAIERATAEAIKRTCPKCNLSFIKSSGCNKLTCVCGYHMCYICREELGKEGYTHFCEHFRADPGKACTRCNKCDLYKTEDEEQVIRKAAYEAEKQWIEKEAAAGVRRKNWNLGMPPGPDPPEDLHRSVLVKLLNDMDWESSLDLIVEMLLE